MQLFGIILGGIIAYALFYPFIRDHDFERNVEATLYRYHSRYGR